MPEYEERDSGLCVPKEEPKREYGPTEITDPELREVAKRGLEKLWRAMSLDHCPGGLQVPGSPSEELYESRRQLHEYIGKTLLGPDAPDFEVFT